MIWNYIPISVSSARIPPRSSAPVAHLHVINQPQVQTSKSSKITVTTDQRDTKPSCIVDFQSLPCPRHEYETSTMQIMRMRGAFSCRPTSSVRAHEARFKKKDNYLSERMWGRGGKGNYNADCLFNIVVHISCAVRSLMLVVVAAMTAHVQCYTHSSTRFCHPNLGPGPQLHRSSLGQPQPTHTVLLYACAHARKTLVSMVPR